MPANTDAILASYVEAGVFLSVSGHYHAGQPLTSSGSTRYYTVPSGGEEPFRFGFLRLGGRDVEASEHTLRMSVPGLVDVHCHSEYSYCGTTVNAADNIRVARLLGVQKQFFTEHAFQLYFNREDAWSWRWQTDEAMVRNAWAAGRGRMPEFREFARRIRAPDVRVGLELDLRADGSLLLAEEDRSGWDLLVGAVHALPGFPKGSSDQALAEKLLLKDTERILSQPIQVLAHPFRFFRRGNLQRPVHLYKTVADLLAQAGVAAEVNFHTNQPDPRFVEECLSRGVRIALATDAHDLAEVGEFAPHLAVLRQAGVRDEDLPRVLFRPD
jgi:histidinol phosphatase-like PHP family hydrolase